MAKLVINKDIAGANSGTKFLAKMRPVAELNIHPELSKRFTIEQQVLDSIIKSITESNYDNSEPIIIWKEEDVVIDGHTRLEAAKCAGIEEVPVVEKSFENLEEAMKYTEHRQYDRRNLSQAEIYKLAINLDTIKEKTGEGRATERLAKKIGVSASTLEHARTIEKRASEDIKDKIKNNKITIPTAYAMVKQKKEKNIDFDSINVTSDDPAGLNFNHSDGIERPTYPKIADELPSNSHDYENDESNDNSIESVFDEFNDIADSTDVIENNNLFNCLFEKIQSFNLKELAIFLEKIQKESLYTALEWEEILAKKEQFVEKDYVYQKGEENGR